MAKQVIILGVSIASGQTFVNAAFWYAITSGQKSQTNGSVWAGASAAENTAIQNGSVLEEQGTFSFPSTTTKAQVETYLQQNWAVRNSQIGGLGPALFSGVFLDSVNGWSS